MFAADLFPFRHELRAGTLAAVVNLPEEHWEWRPPAGVHTIKSWLWHISAAEDALLQGAVLGRTGYEARRRPPRAERDQVLGYLEQTRAATERYLREATAEEVLADTPVYEALCKVFQHEAHHRAQIYLYIRLMGLQPPKA